LATEAERQRKHADLPEGIKELIEMPGEESAHAPSSSPTQREKTQKEQELDSLIAKRQAILDSLKAKNPVVAESRRKLSRLIAALRGKGGGRTMGLVAEADRIEFAIATEADTPKKEKELIKRLKAIRAEIAKNKELDAARKEVDAERHSLNTLTGEVKGLERQLVEARKACDEAYVAVLAERKEAYEQRQRSRMEKKERKFEGLRRRVKQERKRERDSEMEKYRKDYDDTVSMEEIVVFEKKAKKEGKESADEKEE
jgi:uncharacterized coiled-coil DUF342 family protein